MKHRLLLRSITGPDKHGLDNFLQWHGKWHVSEWTAGRLYK